MESPTLQGLADIENNVAREMTKLGAVIQVPFRSGNQFLGEGGLQASAVQLLSSVSRLIVTPGRVLPNP